jgi:ParB family transcriptional regulator, chromosome partitioning protein
MPKQIRRAGRQKVGQKIRELWQQTATPKMHRVLTSPSPCDTLGAMAKPALGRGLGALLGGSPIAKPPAPITIQTAAATPVPLEAPERVQRVPLHRIRACPLQPRKDFSPETLRELADSIREQGIVQPLIVRERHGHLELIAGERRWRAAQLVGLAEVPVILREADDRSVLELALIENLQRENLNPIEEAHGYAQLIEQFELKQEEVATKVGKSRAAVANALRLLKLPAALQVSLREGRLSVGHAKVILGLPGQKEQELAAERVLKDGLNVRQTEGLVARLLERSNQPPDKKMAPAGAPADTHVLSLENQLRERLGTKVHLRYSQGKGAVEISFFSDAELERLLQIIGVTADSGFPT